MEILAVSHSEFDIVHHFFDENGLESNRFVSEEQPLHCWAEVAHSLCLIASGLFSACEKECNWWRVLSSEPVNLHNQWSKKCNNSSHRSDVSQHLPKKIVYRQSVIFTKLTMACNVTISVNSSHFFPIICEGEVCRNQK